MVKQPADFGLTVFELNGAVKALIRWGGSVSVYRDYGNANGLLLDSLDIPNFTDKLPTTEPITPERLWTFLSSMIVTAEGNGVKVPDSVHEALDVFATHLAVPVNQGAASLKDFDETDAAAGKTALDNARLQSELAAAQAEVKRLREALKGLLDALDDQYLPPDPKQFPPGTFEYALDNERIEAREALNQK